LSGWRWDFEPNPPDTSNENGKIVFEIKIDDRGEIISVRTLEKTVSPEVERIYRQEVESLTFSPIAPIQGLRRYPQVKSPLLLDPNNCMRYQEVLDYLYEKLPMYQRVGPPAFKKDLTNTIDIMLPAWAIRIKNSNRSISEGQTARVVPPT
jgi:hypothetical protein